VGSIPTENSSQKLKLAAAQFTITYPDYYKGNFDTDKIEVRIKKQKSAAPRGKWDKENHLVEIYPQEPVLQQPR